MGYQDRVYGKIKILEPVVLELVNSPSLQRLKQIDQAGYFEPFFPNTAHSRFEHSLGVFCLLKRYDLPLEEQIAGLIHDVSHSVFSHCIDYTLDGGSEKKHCHQDNIFKEFVKKTEIPDILKKYNFDLDYILDDKNFPFKEKELPDLCADRIDYSLRGGLIFRELGDNDLKCILDNLVVENNNWLFQNFKSAKKYAELFLKLNRKYYAGLLAAVMLRTVGDCLQYALKKGYIEKDDLYTVDEIVLEKIKKYASQDKNLELLFERMNNKIGFHHDEKNFDVHVFCKSRIVNPICKNNNKQQRLSDVDPNWNNILEEESKPKEYFIKFDR